MSYRLHNVVSFEPVGSTVYHYGYKCEVKEDGQVWADIPDELYETELLCGRIREESPKIEQVVVSQVVLAVADSVEEVSQPAVVEDTVKVEKVTAKIDGRSKAARQSKSK